MDAARLYQCDSCQGHYAEQEAAIKCCPPTCTVGWVCGNCDEMYANSPAGKKLAEECCKVKDKEEEKKNAANA